MIITIPFIVNIPLSTIINHNYPTNKDDNLMYIYIIHTIYNKHDNLIYIIYQYLIYGLQSYTELYYIMDYVINHSSWDHFTGSN